MNREFRLRCGLLALLVLTACSDRGSVELGDGQSTDTGGATDYGIAYIKHSLPTDPADLAVMRNKDDLRHYRRYWSKADVCIRSQAAESGVETNVTARVTGSDFYDVKDLDVSADGKFLVFAMRGPLQTNQRDFNPPNWRIWEYDIANDDLHSITDDVTASEGQDISPHYLPSDSAHPNGRILIASTRQRDSKLVLLTEGKSGFEAQTEDVRESAFTLSVLDPTQTGPSAFQQISFNPSHDINPTVLSDGRIIYTRWSHTPAAGDQRHASVHDQPRRHQRPAAVRRAQSLRRHRGSGHRPAHGGAVRQGAARCRTGASWRSSDRSTPVPISAAIW